MREFLTLESENTGTGNKLPSYFCVATNYRSKLGYEYWISAANASGSDMTNSTLNLKYGKALIMWNNPSNVCTTRMICHTAGTLPSSSSRSPSSFESAFFRHKVCLQCNKSVPFFWCITLPIKSEVSARVPAVTGHSKLFTFPKQLRFLEQGSRI